MRRLAILGAGGHGISVAEAATLDGWEDVVFFDDEPEKRNMKNRFGEVTGDTQFFDRSIKFIRWGHCGHWK